jgi:hypothetical protein
VGRTVLFLWRRMCEITTCVRSLVLLKQIGKVFAVFVFKRFIKLVVFFFNSELASVCWHRDPRLRPAFRDLLLSSLISASASSSSSSDSNPSFLSTGIHPPVAPQPSSLRSQLNRPLQPDAPGVAVLYACMRGNESFICCVRESDGLNAGIFNLPSGECNFAVDRTLQDALQRVFFLDLGRHMDRRISSQQLAIAPVCVVGRVFVALVVENEVPVLRRNWNERAAEDEESETDELELVAPKE